MDPLSCGYKPKRPGSKRSKRLEWEHVVPASFIGRNKACWKEGHAECVSRKGKAYKGRRCCNKVDKQFRKAAADLKNLVPSIGEINMDRSNFAHSEVEGEAREYGSCDFEVNRKLRTAEPAVHLRGFIGRTWIYMEAAHELDVPAEDKTVYRAWAEAYPVEQWELDRSNRIEKTLLESSQAVE